MSKCTGRPKRSRLSALKMKGFCGAAVAAMVLTTLPSAGASIIGAPPGVAVPWATLPSNPSQDPHCAGLGASGGCPGHPEGMTTDIFGNMYAASFELPAPYNVSPDPGGPFTGNLIYVFNPFGQFKYSIALPAGAAGVVPLGMQFDLFGDLFVLDVLHGTVLEYKPPLSASSLPEHIFDVCGGYFATGPPTGPALSARCALNGGADSLQRLSPDGNLYMSDSVGGSIFEVNLTTCLPTGFQSADCTSRFFYDPRLSPVTTTFPPPPYGANGIAFNRALDKMYVDNMNTGVLYSLSVYRGSNGVLQPGTMTTLTTGLDGPDDIVVDPFGTIWVSNGQKDQIVGIDPQGMVVATVGAFTGLSSDGAPNGLLMPSSLVFEPGYLYADNESNPSIHPPPPTPDGWKDVKEFTIARIALPT